MSFNKLKDFLGDSTNYETGEFDPAKMQEEAIRSKSKVNILLMGATGVGKSSLLNAVFGKDIVEAGFGKPITQKLEKIDIPKKGLTIWDTKGIEAKDYQETTEQLINDIETALNSADTDGYPDIAWLCIKESSYRIEDREHDLLKLCRKHGIPVVFVFTNKQYEAGDKFVNQEIKMLQKEYNDVISNRFVRVNSVEYKFLNQIVPKDGLEELLEATESCFDSVNHNRRAKLNAFHAAQIVNNEKRLAAMVDEAKTIIHVAAGAAGVVGLSPIPGSDAPLIAAAQSAMIYKMNTAFEVDLDNARATSLVTGILGVTLLAQAGKAVVANVLKFIPVAGSILGGAVSAATAVAITEALGFAYLSVLEHFFDKQTGKVNFPVDLDLVFDMVKNNFKP